MNQTHRISIIIPAAGLGKRFNNTLPKQYMTLGHETVLERTVSLFLNIPEVQKIYIPVDANDQRIYSQSFIGHHKIIITAGGSTRSQSVFNAFSKINLAEVDIVAIHDAARPWMQLELFFSLLDELTKNPDLQGVYPVISISDSMREKREEKFIPMDRDNVVLIQTPQIFDTQSLNIALSKLNDTNESCTDESQAMEKAGFRVKAVQGDRSNAKITFPGDLLYSASIDSRIGRGIDFHKFEVGHGIILGNVFIECELSIVAHSDGDIVLHALADSLLGAAGLYDIGYYYPDTDPANKDLNSIKIIEKALGLLKEKKFKPVNVDLTIVCEKPKISPQVDAIKKALSILLELPEANIAIKATTTEGMGVIGKGNGIAVYAISSLETIK